MKKSILLFSLLCMTMLPPIAEAGWVNVYKSKNPFGQIFDSREQAIKASTGVDGHLTTIEISHTWEE